MGENPQSMMPENSGSFPFFHPVSKLIKGPIQIIGPEATASDCARKMSEASIGSLVVIAQQSMIGIVTSTDLVEKVLALKKKDDCQVSEIMSSPVICIRDSRKGCPCWRHFRMGLDDRTATSSCSVDPFHQIRRFCGIPG